MENFGPLYVPMVRIITATFYSLLEVGTKYEGVRLKKVTFTTPTAEAGEINEFGWVIGHPTLFGVLHFGMPLSIIIYCRGQFRSYFFKKSKIRFSFHKKGLNFGPIFIKV